MKREVYKDFGPIVFNLIYFFTHCEMYTIEYLKWQLLLINQLKETLIYDECAILNVHRCKKI